MDPGSPPRSTARPSLHSRALQGSPTPLHIWACAEPVVSPSRQTAAKIASPNVGCEASQLDDLAVAPLGGETGDIHAVYQSVADSHRLTEVIDAALSGAQMGSGSQYAGSFESANASVYGSGFGNSFSATGFGTGTSVPIYRHVESAGATVTMSNTCGAGSFHAADVLKRSAQS